jgi:ApbE superfamily uncharacterized protein (UPF0280 family)
MDKLNALMESEEMKVFVESNQEMIDETAKATEEFTESLKDYVLNNPEVFIDSTVENIQKNIRIFSEAAVCQFLTEVTSMNSVEAKLPEEPVTPENALNDYI